MSLLGFWVCTARELNLKLKANHRWIARSAATCTCSVECSPQNSTSEFDLTGTQKG